MPGFNIWNDRALRNWIESFADGNGRTAELLCLALEKPLRTHRTALKQLDALPPDAPGWLKEKFRAAAFHTFDPTLDPGLDEKIRHIRDWIAGAVASEEPWTKEEKPKRLLHFKIVDDAMTAADKAMKKEALRLREVFKNNPAALDDENVKTVMTLEDGFRIVRLLTPEALDRESAAMGHCIGNGGYDKKLRSNEYAYYSLRDSANNPHATLEVENGTLLQCKGKQNVPPEERYFPALRAFIERERFLLAEDHAHTGLWQAPDGAYHSIRRLPTGAQIKGNLDLSSLRDVVLPEDLSVTGKLSLNSAAPPALPAELKAKMVVWRKNGKTHREDGPAGIERDPLTGTITRETWWLNNRSHREDGPAEIERDPRTDTITRETWWLNGLPHREGAPAKIERDPETGVIVKEVWCLKGQIHREGVPALIERDPKTGTVVKEVWWLNGNPHREGAPALIERDPKTGTVVKEVWWLNGLPHREGAPAKIERDPETGTVVKEVWYLNGLPHREGAPAKIERDAETGVITKEKWRLNGRFHREDGPAYIERDPETGVITHEEWCLNGCLHREDGPAHIERDPKTGAVTKEKWWKNGQESRPPPLATAKGASPHAHP